jgi:hypothetical protein
MNAASTGWISVEFLLFAAFMKIRPGNPDLLKCGQKCRALYFIVFGEIKSP